MSFGSDVDSLIESGKEHWGGAEYERIYCDEYYHDKAFYYFIQELRPLLSKTI